MLTARHDEVDKVRGLELGADDYITKPFSHLELLARARAVLRHSESQVPAAEGPPFAAGPLRIDYASREVTVEGKPVKLTPIEYGILYHLSRNENRVLTFRTLLAKVWGREYVDEVDYLKVHIQHLRRKLGDDPDNQPMIVNERGVGYKFVRPDRGAVRSR
jgi:DNA-binding response OmpR family regulator